MNPTSGLDLLNVLLQTVLLAQDQDPRMHATRPEPPLEPQDGDDFDLSGASDLEA